MSTTDYDRRADSFIFFEGEHPNGLERALKIMLGEASACDQEDLDDKRAPCFGVRTLVDRRANFLDALLNSMMPPPYRAEGNLLRSLPASTVSNLDCVLDRETVR